jgi:inorganic pyrophosphatase
MAQTSEFTSEHLLSKALPTLKEQGKGGSRIPRCSKLFDPNALKIHMNKKGKSARKGPTPPKAHIIEVVIETPKGSRNKFKYEPTTQRFKLAKVLPEGMVFPYDFGFVPATKGPDGDPIDVLVLVDEPTFPGCSLECRLVGILEAEQKARDQKKKRNDRLIAVAEQSLLYADIAHLGDLNRALLKQVEAFFVNYQKVRDVSFTILAHAGPERALEVLRGTTSKKNA